MRDWDRNGRIDGMDHYIFHEIILKDDTENNNAGYCSTPVRRNIYTEKETKPKKKEEVSGYEIIFKVLFGILVVIGLFVS